jgi:outer membrane protein assembly factor BamB
MPNADVRIVMAFLIVCLCRATIDAARAGRFEDLGIPVRKAGLKGCIVGPDATGQRDLLYFNFNQAGAPLFLVAVDPDTGEAKQYGAPEGPGAWAFILGPDDKIYLGTWDGGLVLRFDPKQPERGIEVVGRPAPTETYIWQYANGADGRIYGCTYPQAKLVSYDPASGEMRDLGRMDETQMYARLLAAGANGKIYVGTGYERPNIVVYDPATGERRALLPDTYRGEAGVGTVSTGPDGTVHAAAGGRHFRIDDETLVPIPAADYPSAPPLRLRDGRIIAAYGDGTYSLRGPDTGETVRRQFRYEGAGSGIFVVGAGPEGRIYGSTALPLEMFAYDPAAGELRDLGNPTSVGGELYSLVDWHGLLYVCAYPGSWLSVYDPAEPWHYGTDPDSNPRGFGRLGDGHLRPRAMIVGPGDRLYIGSFPPYGELGGAMAVFDPVAGKVIENYRHLIPNQSITALVHEQHTGLVIGGSGIAGGGGSTPSEKEAHLFAWDADRKRTVADIIPTPGDSVVVALAALDGKAFAATEPSHTLVLYDPVKGAVVQRAAVPFGRVHDISVAPHDGMIWGLAGNTIFSVDPASLEFTKVAEYPGGITCGFAITDTGIYFGSGVHLVRYRW